MINIETKNTGKSISEKKLKDLFSLANNSSQIVKNGSILITKESPDNFHIAHNNISIGSMNYSALKDEVSWGFENNPNR